MKAFVTGANGLLGSTLCRTLLEDGWSVKGLVRPSSNRRALEGLDVEVVEGGRARRRRHGARCRRNGRDVSRGGRLLLLRLRQGRDVPDRGARFDRHGGRGEESRRPTDRPDVEHHRARLDREPRHAGRDGAALRRSARLLRHQEDPGGDPPRTREGSRHRSGRPATRACSSDRTTGAGASRSPA